MSQQQKIRRIVLTASVAAITATGAWYGAGLRIKDEAKTISEKRREATVEEKLALLDEKRGQLVTKRIGLERKIAELDARKMGATREESRMGQERRS